MKSYLKFVHRPDLVTGVTQVWDVRTTTDVQLGRIGWYASWRRYVFAPITERPSLFDADCLKELAEFCQSETDKRKAARVAEK